MKKLILLVLAGGLLSGPALARDHGPGPAPDLPSFAQIDANGDGKIVVSELNAQLRLRFDAGDSDKDGFLSAEELGQNILARLDRNGDDRVGLDEVMPPETGERLFARLDRNADGVISEAEFPSREKGKMIPQPMDGLDAGHMPPPPPADGFDANHMPLPPLD